MPKKKTSTRKKKSMDQTIKFELIEPEANSVYLVGSFNNWSTIATPMKKTQDSWTINMKLIPGIHEYLFYVDGIWKNDPKGTDFKNNPYGARNNTIIVK